MQRKIFLQLLKDYKEGKIRTLEQVSSRYNIAESTLKKTGLMMSYPNEDSSKIYKTEFINFEEFTKLQETKEVKAKKKSKKFDF